MIATVDVEDYQRVNALSWIAVKGHGTWYAVSTNSSGRIQMHHFVLSVALDKQIDHKDGNGLNNVKANLRAATISQNHMNRRKLSNCSSQYKGVTWVKSSNKWRARIKKDYATTDLGLFITEREAAIAYDAAAIELFGEYARTNF